MTRPKILHLVDDTTPGGVMRVLHHLCSDARLTNAADHDVLRVGRRCRLKDLRGADVLVSHLSISWRRLPWLIGLRAAYAHTPLIHVEHSYTESFTALNVPHTRRFRRLLSAAYALFERVVAVSAAQGDWLLQRGLVTEAQRVVIPSAVDVAPFLALNPAGSPARIFGAIGRLEAQKGFDTLIQAFRGCDTPGLELRIFGQGAERARLERLAAGDPRIRFMGQADPVAAMASVDAVVMPSRWEAYGLVALESRAAARPLLVAPVDGLRDHIAAGAVAVDGGVDGWTDAIARVASGGVGDVAGARQDAARATDAFADAWLGLIDELVCPQTESMAA